MEWEFVICSGCAGQGSAVAEALGAAGLPVTRAACLSVCDAPLTVAIQGLGRATYVFRDVTLAQVEALQVFARLYQEAEAGWIEDARPLGDLRMQLVTRVPAMVTAQS